MRGPAADGRTNFERGTPRGGWRRQWYAGHRGTRNGGSGTRRKRSHSTWWGAFFHAVRHNRKYQGLERVHPYPCTWADNYADGMTAPRHWHVGHATKDDMWGY